MELNEIISRTTTLFMSLLGCKENAVTPSALLVSDLGMDSLDTVEMVMAAEEEFEITLDDEQVERLATVRDLFELINTKVGNPPAAQE